MDYWRRQLEQPFEGEPPDGRSSKGKRERPSGSPPSSDSNRPPSWGADRDGTGAEPPPPSRGPGRPLYDWAEGGTAGAGPAGGAGGAGGAGTTRPQQPPSHQPPPQPPSQPGWSGPSVPPSPPAGAAGGSRYSTWSPRPLQPRGYGYGPGLDDDTGDERAARLTAILLAVGVAALVVGLIVFFTVKTLRQNRNEAADAPTVTTPADAAKVIGGLGPPQGTDVPTYIANRGQELAGATGDRVAVVSMNAYVSEAKARTLVGSAEVVGLLAAAPAGAPAFVTGDMASWVRTATADARAERDEIQRLIPTASNDPTFQNFYKSEVDRLNKLLNSIKPDGNLVFGVVVRAPATALQQLATNSEVRLVDVGPPGATESSSYRGLRPEETSRANEPNTRPQ